MANETSKTKDVVNEGILISFYSRHIRGNDSFSSPTLLIGPRHFSNPAVDRWNRLYPISPAIDKLPCSISAATV